MLGGRHSGYEANRPTFAGESRRKCPTSRSSSLGRWVFGEALAKSPTSVGQSHDEQSSRGSLVSGRHGSGRGDLGQGSHVSPQVRANPRTTVECPLSLQHAASRGHHSARKWLRTARASFLEVSPRSRGKDELRQGQRPATGSTSVERSKPLGSGLSLLARQQRASRACHWRRKALAARARLPRLQHHLARGATGRPSA